jgi:hypothetical protein
MEVAETASKNKILQVAPAEQGELNRHLGQPS